MATQDHVPPQQNVVADFDNEGLAKFLPDLGLQTGDTVVTIGDPDQRTNGKVSPFFYFLFPFILIFYALVRTT